MPAVPRLPQMPHDGIRIVQERWRRRAAIELARRRRGKRRTVDDDAVPAVRHGRLRHVGQHVEAVEGEVDGRVHLARRLGLGGREALEVDDKELREAGQRDALGGFALTLAVGAFPDFVAGEPFFLAVALEAGLDVGDAGVRDLDADAVKGFVRG